MKTTKIVYDGMGYQEIPKEELLNKHKLDHIGWITHDIETFELFWCHVLGFELEATSTLTVDMAKTLFGLDQEAKIKRYVHPESDLCIEIHHFEKSEYASQSFSRFGINHIAFLVPNRKEFLEQLPEAVEKKIYDNPGGWQNIFIRDFEGNWVELREKF